MGKARIKTDYGSGAYSIEIPYINSYVTDTIARLNAKITYIESHITTIEETVDDLFLEWWVFYNSPGASKSVVHNARQAYENSQLDLAFAKGEKLALEKRLDRFTRLAVKADFERYVWCVDLTEGLSGEVATLEIGTEHDIQINILPGYAESPIGNIYNTDTHGFLVPFFSLPVADGLRNFLAMPAIQKWKPSYRTGLITNIDYEANLCDVNLDFVQSHVQDLNINHTNTLTSVGIEYMECNAGAFEDGDHVVVMYEDFDINQPKVIGFSSNPKPCNWTEPFDGPEVDSKHTWNNIIQAASYDPDPPSLLPNIYYEEEVVDGVGQFTALSLPNSLLSGQHSWFDYYQVWHHDMDAVWQIRPMNYVTFNAFSQIDCSGYRYWGDQRYLALVGHTISGETQTDHLFYLYIMDTVYEPYTDGCIGTTITETNWELTGGIWKKLIPPNTSKLISLPVSNVYITEVGIVIASLAYIGGLSGTDGYPVPEDSPGGYVNVNHIALL